MWVSALDASSHVANTTRANEKIEHKKAWTPTHHYITEELVWFVLDMRRARAVIVKSLLAIGGSVFILCLVYFNAIPRQEFTERPNKGNALWGATNHRVVPPPAPHRRLAGIGDKAAKVLCVLNLNGPTVPPDAGGQCPGGWRDTQWMHLNEALYTNQAFFAHFNRTPELPIVQGCPGVPSSLLVRIGSLFSHT